MSDAGWLHDLALLIGVTGKVGEDKTICNMIHAVKAFKVKLQHFQSVGKILKRPYRSY